MLKYAGIIWELTKMQIQVSNLVFGLRFCTSKELVWMLLVVGPQLEKQEFKLDISFLSLRVFSMRKY